MNTQEDWQVRLINNVGQVVLTQKSASTSPLEIATSAYESGIYFVEFQSDKEQWMKKIVIQH